MQAEGEGVVERRAHGHHTRGVALCAEERFEDAIVAFSKAIFLAPERAENYRGRGEAYLAICDFKSAA